MRRGGVEDRRGSGVRHFSEALDLRMNPSRTRALADIAILLFIAPEIMELKAALSPKPVPKLHGDHIEAIQTIGRRLSRARPESLRSSSCSPPRA